MTMKTKKTLQHIAAVAVVLLTLCLVFAAPVSAKEVVLEIENPENTGSTVTTFTVKVGDETVLTGKTLQDILGNHTYMGKTLLEDGDTVKIGAGDIYTANNGIIDIYGNITIIGAGEDKTNITISGAQGGKDIRLTNRMINSYQNGIIYEFNFKDLTFKAANNAKRAFYISDYNIEVNAENVSFVGFTDTVFGVFTGGKPEPQDDDYVNYPLDKTLSTTINLINVETTGAGNVFSAEVLPWANGAWVGWSSVSLNFDENTAFDNTGNGKGSYVSKDQTVTYEIKDSSKPFQKNVFINGEDITLGSAVAQIDDTYYGTLAEAVEKATDGQTVTLLKDAEGEGIVTDGQNVVIDFGGFTYTINELVGSAGTETNGFQLKKGSDVELKNGKIEVSESVSEDAGILIQNYANLTLSDITLDGTNLENTNACYTLSNNCGLVTIDDGTIIIAKEGDIAFDVCYAGTSYPLGTHVTVESGATINGNIEFGVWTGESPINPASSLRINGGTFNGNLVVDGELTEAAKSLIVIYGGTFSSNPSAYIASGMEVVQPGDKYLVQEYVDRSSSSSSSVKPEEPEQPEEPVVEPETPTEEPVAGEPTVETEVTDGGEVTFETPETPEAGEPGDAPSDAPAEPAVTGVVLPDGTDSEVAFIPVSEKPAPAGKETQTKKVFEINVPTYEKGKPATVKFTMTVAELEKDGKTAADVALWHQDEETGEWTKLVTTFIIKDGIVYFEAITFDFSPFAIVYEDVSAPTEPETPEQPEEPASPAPVLAVLAALGAAVVLRRK